jgi:hypothetical protein
MVFCRGGLCPRDELPAILGFAIRAMIGHMVTPGQRNLIIVGVAAALIGGFFLLVPAIPQDPQYHQFADQRRWLGIPNFANVVSNVAFLAVSVWGLWRLYATPEGAAFRAHTWTRAYAVFFAAVAFVAPGSTYYHLATDDAALVWDRLPMSVAFMALLSAVIADRLGVRAGKMMLWPLILVGVGSVLYWIGVGDLRPYILVQFLPIALLPLVCALFPSQSGLSGKYLATLVLLYGLAKVCESADEYIWQALAMIISGHTLKHLVAAAACATIIVFIARAPVSLRT